MRKSISLVCLFLMTIGLGACGGGAHHSPSSSAPGAEATPVLPFAPKAFVQKTPELGRFAIAQLAHTLANLNFALSYRLEDRMMITSPSQTLGDGCRLVSKTGPSYERTFDTNVEELLVSYVKCTPEKVDDTPVTSAQISGAEAYTIVYDKPYPRQSNPDLVLGYPTFIGMQTAPMNVTLTLHSGAQVVVQRLIRLSAKRVDENDAGSTYLVSNTITDTYSQTDHDGTVAGQGTVNVAIDELRVTVKKDRSISALQAAPITLTVNGERSKQTEQVTLTLTPDGALGVPASVCVPPTGLFQLADPAGVAPASAIGLTVSDDGVAIDGADPRAVKLCDDPQDVYFLDEFGSVYL